MGVPYAEVIGDPISHSKSPLMHKFWIEKLGLDADYRATRVTREELPAYLEQRRADEDWRGCNVTMPLKEAAWTLVDSMDPCTRRIGALNTVLHYSSEPGGLMGANTDWIGLNLALATHRLTPRHAAIVGTGGAARAAMEEMRQAKIRDMAIIARSEEKAAQLLRDFKMAGRFLPLGSAPCVDLLINASPLGMMGHPPLPIDLSRLPSGAIVVDLVYDPLETELLRDARDRGLKTVDGLAVLIWQASMAFTYFFGEAPGELCYDELRAKLTS